MANELKFVHLHVHTTFSLLDGLSFRGDLIKKAKDYNMGAVAVTEHGNLCQHVSFYQDCIKEGVKPILGIEAYLAPDSHKNRDYDVKSKLETGDISHFAYHIIILAKNKLGYQNLMKLSTASHRFGFYRKPRIDFELLQQYKEGLIVTSGCIGSIISQSIIQGRKDLALDYINKFRFMFNDDFYLEVMHHQMPEDKIVCEALIDFGQRLGIPLVLTNDSHYTNREDAIAQEVLLCTTTHKPLSDPEHWRFEGAGYWFKSPEEMAQVVVESGYPIEAFDNTAAIAAKVDPDYGFRLAKKHGHMVPLFKDSSGNAWTTQDSHQKLVMACYEGMANLKTVDPADGVMKAFIEIPKYVERLQHELDTIERKNFSSYFLIIADIIQFIKRHGGMFPPFGRGSSVGSLVCRSLGITAMDPIRWNVPFYRFINDGRKDLPDIDTDISQRHRNDVLDYIVRTYGADHVAHIVTFQTMAAKKAIDDAGAALDVPPPVRKSVSQLIGDTDKDDKLEDLLKDHEEAHNLMVNHAEWIKITSQLEGVHRNTGLHAAGIVISNEPIEDHVPLLRDVEGYRVTQWDMKDVQDLGLLKLDMLGLRTLDTIWDAVELIKKLHNIEVDIFNLPFDDKETYKTVYTADFVSIFQYDSPGMRNMARNLRAEKFEQLMALNALFRPGPMKPQIKIVDGKEVKAPSIADIYLACRHGRQEVETWHPSLDEVMSDTYGMPLYQEQISEMSKIIAGFTDVEADEYRAAIGKKDAVKFMAAQDKFKHHGIKMGHTEAFMEDLCKKLAGFARYGWNRGHAAGYSYISYVTAYLETHFPVPYYTALLNTNLDKQDKLETLLGAIMQKGIEINPPDVNSSGAYFSTNGKAIYMGLLSVKQLASEALLTIIRARQKAGGEFSSFIDFVRHVSSNIEPMNTNDKDFIQFKLPDWDYKKSPEIPPTYQLKAVNKSVIVNLIKAGAFKWDAILTDLDKIGTVETIQKIVKKRPTVEEFQVIGRLDGKITSKEFTQMERSALEREALSFYVSGHPVTNYVKYINIIHSEGQIITPSQLNNANVHCHVVVLGLLVKKEMKMTKKNTPFVTLRLQDQFGEKSVRIFSPLSTEIWPSLVDDKIVLVRGVTQPDNFQPDQIDLKVRSVLVVTDGLPVRGFITDTAAMVDDVNGKLGIQPAAVQEVPGWGHVVHFSQMMRLTPDVLNKFTHHTSLKLALAI